MRKIIIIFGFLVYILSAGFSEDNSTVYLFDNLSLDDGLPNTSISSIQEDSLGFIWFGTQSGLVRYDGYNFDVWNHDVFNKNSLPHGLVQTLYIDEHDVIWVGTYNGISRFDPSTGTFTNYEYEEGNKSSISNNVVTSIAKDLLGRIWIATLGGLNRLDPETGQIVKYYHDENDPGSLMNDIVRSVLVDSIGRIWIGNLSGLDLYNVDSDSFTHYRGFPSPYVMKILEENKETLLVGTWGGGLTSFDIINEKYENISFEENSVYTMEKDSKDRIWIGTWGGGLFIYDRTENTIEHLKTDSLKKSTLNSDTIYSIFNDSSHNIWIGTNGGGVGVLNPYKEDYNFLSYDELNDQSIGQGKVEALLDVDGREFWVGIYNDGVRRLDRETGEIKHYYHSDDELESSLSNNIVSDLLKDRSGRIWVATNEGLNLYNRQRDIFERIRLIPEEDVNAFYTYTVLYEDRAGYIWIGSHNVGLVRYNPQNDEIILYSYDPGDQNSLSDNLVYSILERDNGEFWIGTNNGLNLLERDTGLFTRYRLDRDNPEGLNNNAIRVLIENDNGEMWIGTGGGGINVYDDSQKTFFHLTGDGGLSNNFIVSLIEDASGKIWAGTKHGLSIINPVTRNVSVLNKERGLDSMEFSFGSVLGFDGAVYLGSYGRVYRFEDEGEIPNEFIMGVNLRSIEINGEMYEDFSTYKPGGEIVLDYNDARNLSFEFVALNYLGTLNTFYSYKLENFDADWSTESERPYANYTNIPPGEYIFQVRASAGLSGTGLESHQQKIVISPPFWMTWWAYGLYLFIFLGVLYLFISLRISLLGKQKIKELNEAHSYLENILNSMPSIIIGIDRNLLITEWNDRAGEVYGVNSGYASGRSLYSCIPDFPISLEVLKRNIKSGETFNMSKRIETENNEIRNEVISVYPQNTAGIDSAVIRIDDVTRQVRMEEVLVQSEKMLSVGGLAAGMAHEINNPLAGMIQNAQVLEHRLLKGSDNKYNISAADEAGITMGALSTYMTRREIPKIIRSINESGHRISDLVENMLSFSQKNNTKFAYQALPGLMDKTIELAASDYNLKKKSDFKSIQIKKEYEENLPEILCERSKIQQVLLNILRNGAEAMEESGGSNPLFRIGIYNQPSHKQITLEIENNGPGISQEVQKRIFEPFFTTKAVGVGTGLGLSISYFIIKENHGGEIEVKSSEEGGATFIITLPVG